MDNHLLIKLIASIVEENIQLNKQLIMQYVKPTLFTLSEESDIDFTEYLLRMSQYMVHRKISKDDHNALWVSAFIYAQRYLVAKNDHYNPFNIHLVFGIAFALAIKFYCDDYWSNSHMARVLGIGLSRFNKLELEFYFVTRFSLQISEENYDEIYEVLKERYQNKYLVSSQKENIPSVITTMMGNMRVSEKDNTAPEAKQAETDNNSLHLKI